VKPSSFLLAKFKFYGIVEGFAVAARSAEPPNYLFVKVMVSSLGCNEREVF
jgi:hypothetical protein